MAHWSRDKPVREFNLESVNKQAKGKSIIELRHIVEENL